MSNLGSNELFNPYARLELVEAIEYYRSISPDLARAFKKAFDEAIAEIHQFPEIAPWIQPSTYQARRKNLEKFPYYIAYLIEPDCIFIAAVAHNRRDPGYWLSRLKEPGK